MRAADVERVRVDDEVRAGRHDVPPHEAVRGRRLRHRERREGFQPRGLGDAGGEVGGAAKQVGFEPVGVRGEHFGAQALLAVWVRGQKDGVPGYAAGGDVEVRE